MKYIYHLMCKRNPKSLYCIVGTFKTLPEANNARFLAECAAPSYFAFNITKEPLSTTALKQQRPPVVVMHKIGNIMDREERKLG